MPYTVAVKKSVVYNDPEYAENPISTNLFLLQIFIKIRR